MSTMTMVTPEDIAAARVEVERLETQHQEVQSSAEKDLKEMKAAHGGALPAGAEYREKVQELFAEPDKLALEVDAARGHLAKLQAKAFGTDPDDTMSGKQAAKRGHDVRDVVSLSERFLQSEEWQKVASRDGKLSLTEVLRIRDIQLADSVETARLLAPLAKSAVTLGPLVPEDLDRVWPPTGFPQRTPRLLDLLTVTTTESDTVDYTVVTDSQGNVTAQPPGTAFNRGNYTTERRTEQVRDRGTLLDVPERNLEDEGRIRRTLELEMTRWLRLEAEAQVVLGDGTGENFTGITNWAGVNSRQRANGQAIADAIHEGITDIRIAYFEEPDAIAFRPETWHTLLTERGNDGHYVNIGGPFGSTPMSIWGKGAVASTLLRDGTGNDGGDPMDCIVGFWPEAELVVRQGVGVREFEQNNDNAEKRLVTLRGLWRGAFILNQPVAFSIIDLEEAAA